MDLKVLKSQWDRAAAIALTAIGGLCFVLGYIGVADSEILAEQTRYIVSGGLGGIFLLGLGATLWISADLRDEWNKLDRIENALAGGVLQWSDESDTGVASQVAEPAANSNSHSRPTEVSTGQVGLAHAASSREHA